MRILLFFSEAKVKDIQEMQRACQALKAMARCVEAWFAPFCVRQWVRDKVGDGFGLLAREAHELHFSAYPVARGDSAKPKWHMLLHLAGPYISKLRYDG